jgi:3-hydroxyisobutyrate dehydrogenase-like beta-hydroxyacid dehydrogenase
MSGVLGFIGFGEVAYHMSKGLEGAGWGDIVGFDAALSNDGAYADTIRSRAAEAGAVLCDSLADMLARADVVIAAVQAKYAPQAARDALPLMRAGQFYVDVTTAKPASKREMEDAFSARGIRCVDGAMLGPLPVNGHRVPILASGAAAAEWAAMMAPYGMKIEVTEGHAGAASAIKLVRSVFMKGLEALLVETFLFARRSGAEDIVLSSLAATLNVPFENTAQRMIAADLVHAERRAFEVEESIGQMRDVGVEPIMAEAIVRRLKKSASLGTREELGGVAPKTLADVYGIWQKKNYC